MSKFITYGKLIRDKVPGIIQADGLTPVVTTLAGIALDNALVAKVIEEVSEYVAAPCVEELADVLEAVLCLAFTRHGADHATILQQVFYKRERRGSLLNGVYLVRVEFPDED